MLQLFNSDLVLQRIYQKYSLSLDTYYHFLFLSFRELSQIKRLTFKCCVNVDVYRYIDIAKEWGDWVNSSPTERQKFYRNRPDKNFKV